MDLCTHIGSTLTHTHAYQDPFCAFRRVHTDDYKARHGWPLSTSCYYIVVCRFIIQSRLGIMAYRYRTNNDENFLLFFSFSRLGGLLANIERTVRKKTSQKMITTNHNAMAGHTMRRPSKRTFQIASKNQNHIKLLIHSPLSLRSLAWESGIDGEADGLLFG